MKKGRRPRRRPRLKLSDKAGPDQCPVPGENALFPAQIAGFLAVSRAVPVYPVFLNYVVPVQKKTLFLPYDFVKQTIIWFAFCPGIVLKMLLLLEKLDIWGSGKTGL